MSFEAKQIGMLKFPNDVILKGKESKQESYG